MRLFLITAQRWNLRSSFMSDGLTLNEAGGSKCPIRQKIGCHFLQDYAMVTKIIDFVSNYPSFNQVKLFFSIFTDF